MMIQESILVPHHQGLHFLSSGVGMSFSSMVLGSEPRKNGIFAQSAGFDELEELSRKILFDADCGLGKWEAPPPLSCYALRCSCIL